MKKINAALLKIDKDLKVSRIAGHDNKIMQVGVSFPLKGSISKTRALEEMGFHKRRKELRNGSYFQIMEKDINYDKYAIYKTSFGGLKAVLYIDNERDFYRHQVFGKPAYFPMLVNRQGGRCPFDEEIDKRNGFLYIKEVLEDEEPLTREEMFPKNSESFLYGWIDREGNTYACSFEGHYPAAEALCKEKGIAKYNEERALEKAGWIKISRKAPYTPENVGSQCIYFDLRECQATQSQINTLFDLKLNDDPLFEYMLREMEDNYER